VTTYVGNPSSGSTAENIAATSVLLSSVLQITGDSLGNVYYIDSCRIKKVLAGSTLVSTVVGTGVYGYSGENTPALTTKLAAPHAVWVDSIGNTIIGGNDYRIQKWTISTGFVTTIAGNGTYGFSNNLPATSAMFKSVNSIVGDTNGNIYFSDSSANRVMKITTLGILVTYVGNGVFCCYTTDNLPATSVSLSIPYGLQLASNGNLYVSVSGRVLVVEHVFSDYCHWKRMQRGFR
jgi:hypothetical protein